MGQSFLERLDTRLDSIDEFEREPVPENKRKGWKGFLGMYAGEHTAGTEFVIGPLFVAHGVAAYDLIWGLIVGNILAVLSWAFLCAPVAVKTKLTLYWQLRKICGPKLASIYNVVNALMFCFLAGSMIAVSATAVGLPFGIPMPGLGDWLPTSIGWVVTVFIVGLIITLVAILGYDYVARFANIAFPWMILVFVAAALAVLPQLGVHSVSEFWTVAQEKIWTGTPAEGQSKFTFWHVMFFAWFANMAMHIGMSDMSILRFAKKWQHGFSSATGMFFGHFIAWMASGILTAAAAGAIAPGIIAYNSAGVAGAICVVIAGWTTANPTIYRAGLAFQSVTPNWKRWKVTLFTGLVTSIAACFPALVMLLLDFVALYGLVLMPMGAVIFMDVMVFPKIGMKSNFAELVQMDFNWSAGLTWFVTLLLCLFINLYMGVEIFFLGLPGWFIAILLYVGLSKLQQDRFQKAANVEMAKT
ncbi:purine-cytosine permease family protein [Halalkalibaculum sp. DA3122]|uniref:purine-cytosine permease family protein n=1 Tax=Halalkalibaculum sp. DA3122 TaxID=3373607 RepID=UPI0037551B2B